VSNSEIPLEDKITVPIVHEGRFMADLMQDKDRQVKFGLTYVANDVKVDPYENFKLNILSHLLF
jgi:hypothetical protein